MATSLRMLLPSIEHRFDTIFGSRVYYIFHYCVFYEFYLKEGCQFDKLMCRIFFGSDDKPTLTISKAVGSWGLVCSIFNLDYEFGFTSVYHGEWFSEPCLRNKRNSDKRAYHVHNHHLLIIPRLRFHIPAFLNSLHFIEAKLSIIRKEFIEELIYFKPVN